MSDKYLKIIDAYYQARRVDHYYWLHSDLENDPVEAISIENVQWIVSTLKNVRIEKKYLLEEVDSKFHRAFIERWNDGKDNRVWILTDQSEAWQRFSAIKEICHVLLDDEADFQSAPTKTINAVNDCMSIHDALDSVEASSERLAEMVALELCYPLDLRRKDLERTDISAISKSRLVPEKYVSMGLSIEHFKASEEIWKLLPAPDPINLNDYI